MGGVNTPCALLHPGGSGGAGPQEELEGLGRASGGGGLQQWFWSFQWKGVATFLQMIVKQGPNRAPPDWAWPWKGGLGVPKREIISPFLLLPSLKLLGHLRLSHQGVRELVTHHGLATALLLALGAPRTGAEERPLGCPGVATLTQVAACCLLPREAAFLEVSKPWKK